MPDIDVRYSVNEYLGDGTTTEREINFAGGYLLQEHVKSYYTTPEGVVVDQPITFVGPNSVSTAPSAVPAGAIHTVYRQTPIDGPFADFSDGAVVSEKNLDSNARQAVFLAAEARDRFTDDTIVIGNVAAAQLAEYNAEAAAALAIAAQSDAETAAALALSAGEAQAAAATAQAVIAADEADAANVARIAAEVAQEEAETAMFHTQQAMLTSDFYLNARLYVPQGADGHGAITGGSGGTNGTFALAFTGGNFSVNPAGTFTVAGGAVTAVTITGQGIYIGNALSLPTLSFVASAGLTGAACTLTFGYLVGAGGYYKTDHATDPYLVSLFQNQANAAVEVDASLDWANLRLAADWAEKGAGLDVDGSGTRSAKAWATDAAASASAVLDSLSNSQVIGQAQGTPITPTSSGNATHIFGGAVVGDHVVDAFWGNFSSSGSGAAISAYIRSGDTFTPVTPVPLTAPGSGYQEFVTSFEVLDGQYLGVSLGNKLGLTVNTAPSPGMYAGSGSGAITDGSLSTSTRLEVGFNLRQQVVTATSFESLADDVYANGERVERRSVRSDEQTRRAVVFGNSIAGQSEIISGDPDARGEIHWLCSQSGHRINQVIGNAFGYSGQKTDYILAQMEAMNMPDAEVAVLPHLWVNDIIQGGLTVSQTQDNIDAIIDLCRDWDILVLISDGAPHGGLTGPQSTDHVTVRDYVRSLHSPAHGVYVWPTWDGYATVPDGTTAKTNAFRDGIHPTTKGAYYGGVAGAAVLAEMLGDPDVFGYSLTNYCPNPELTGTGGTLAAGITGTLPNGFTAGFNGGTKTGGTAVMSVGSDGDGPYIQAVITGLTVSGSGVPALGVTYECPFASFAVGDRIDAMTRTEVDSGHANLRSVGNGLLYGPKTKTDGVTGSSADLFVPDSWVSDLRPPTFTLPTGFTRVTHYCINVGGVVSTPLTVTVRMRMPIVRKL